MPDLVITDSSRLCLRERVRRQQAIKTALKHQIDLSRAIGMDEMKWIRWWKYPHADLLRPGLRYGYHRQENILYHWFGNPGILMPLNQYVIGASWALSTVACSNIQR